MPPIVHSEVPGSTGKNSPWSRRCSLSWSRVTPASMRQSMSGWLTSMMRVMRDRSSVMPPRTGVTWPSSEVPGAPRHHRHVRVVAQRQQPRRLVRGLDERDGVGQHRRLGVLAVRVVLAQRGVGGDALAQEVAGGGDHGVDGFGHRANLRRGASPIRPASAGWQGTACGERLDNWSRSRSAVSCVSERRFHRTRSASGTRQRGVRQWPWEGGLAKCPNGSDCGSLGKAERHMRRRPVTSNPRRRFCLLMRLVTARQRRLSVRLSTRGDGGPGPVGRAGCPPRPPSRRRRDGPDRGQRRRPASRPWATPDLPAPEDAASRRAAR